MEWVNGDHSDHFYSIQCSKINLNKKNSKRKLKLLLFSGVIVICLKDPTDSPRKLLESINVYNEVSEYKINN